MIYFTADTHFGHENVIRFCGRPYATAAEMDELEQPGQGQRHSVDFTIKK